MVSKHTLNRKFTERISCTNLMVSVGVSVTVQMHIHL